MKAPAVPRDDLQTPDLRGEPTQEGDPSRGPALTFLGSPTRLGRTLPAGGTGFPVVPGYDRMGSRVEKVGFAWERGKVQQA